MLKGFFQSIIENDSEPFLDTIVENAFKQIQCDQPACYNNEP